MLIATNIPSSIAIPFMLLYFFCSIYSLKKLNNWIKIIISFLLLVSTSLLCYFVFKSGFINLCIITIINIIIFKIIEKNNVLEYIFVSLYFVFLKLLSYVIITWIMDLISYEVIFPISYTIYLSDILLFIILLSTTKLFKSYLYKIREYTIFYVAIHIVLILLYLSYLITIFKKGELLIESSIEIFLISSLVLLIYKMVSKVVTVEKENYFIKLHNEELKFNQKNYTNIVHSINEIRKIKHDMNHFLLLLLDYCKNKEYDKIKTTLTQQLKLINDSNSIIDTGNQSLNLILSSQIEKINKENIEFISNSFNEEVYIDKIDFYALLGNLLDNAIENCTSQSIKKILLDIYTEDQYLIVNIKNTTLSNPLLDNPQFHTTKTDSHNHGFGMNTIENIVKKYNGMIIYDYSCNYFIVTLKLTNKSTAI